MKKLSVLLLFMIFGVSAYAQNINDKFYLSDSEKPILIVNNEIVASVSILKNLPKENIKKLNISKESTLSSINLFPIDKKDNGIVEVDIDIELEAKTQQQLNSFFGLDPTNDIYVNGYLLEDKDQAISIKSIKIIELKQADDIILKIAALNITIE